VLVGAVAACGAAGYAIARRGLRPVRAIAAVVGRVRPSHLGERIATAGLPAELLAVAAPLNTMLDRLAGSFDRLTRFSSDIAHELRTPVNNLRGGIEVALGRPRSPDEYHEVLASSLEECGRLTRLVEALLFLARAEDPKSQVAREAVDVGTELAAVREVYEPAAADAGVRLHAGAPAGLRAEVNRPLFQRAVGNLVANAVAHTPAGGEVRVTAETVVGGVVVTVADTGCGIAAADLPHVFDRFYRADPARSAGGANLGLGLAIVRRIMEIHGGAAAVDSAPGMGTRVTLTFPAAG
jgi:two-component system heavy metal sensor histidine kinase CusS